MRARGSPGDKLFCAQRGRRGAWGASGGMPGMTCTGEDHMHCCRSQCVCTHLKEHIHGDITVYEPKQQGLTWKAWLNWMFRPPTRRAACLGSAELPVYFILHFSTSQNSSCGNLMWEYTKVYDVHTQTLAIPSTGSWVNKISTLQNGRCSLPP